MGKGMDVAKSVSDNPEFNAALEDMRDQLLIVFLTRLGGKITLPVSEVDATGGVIMMMGADQEKRTFTFEIRRKH